MLYSHGARFTRVALVALAVIGAARCTTTPSGPIPPGNWGGEHIGLVVSEASATLEYDCASGTVDQPIVVEPGGSFVATGTHTRGHGGPVRQDEVPDRHPARYNGSIGGDVMTLTVTLTDSDSQLGTYTLVRGQSAHVFRCL